MVNARILSLVVLLAASFATTARANPADTFGFGARSTALGGAVVSDVEDFSANYYNPAGLARGHRIRVEAGYLFARPLLRINGRDTGVDDIGAMTAGLVVPAQFGSHHFALGLGLHLNDERISRTRSLPASQPRWEMYDNRPHKVYLSANLAWSPVEWLRIGAGIAFMATSKTNLYVEGEVPVLAPETMSNVRHSLRADLLSIRYPGVGIQIEPNKQWSFGLVYRGEFKLGLDLDATVRARITLGELSVPAFFHLVTESVNSFLPQQLSLGGAWRPIPSVRVSAEVTWVDWSAYETSIAFSDITLDLTIPPEFSAFISDVGTISGSTPIPAHFRDRFVPRVGVEWRALDLPWMKFDVRGGYFYESTPIPTQSALTNFIDTDRHAFSLGIGTSFTELEPIINGSVFIDVTAQASYLVTRNYVKASLLDITGNYTASGSIWALSANAGVTFQ